MKFLLLLFWLVVSVAGHAPLCAAEGLERNETMPGGAKVPADSNKTAQTQQEKDAELFRSAEAAFGNGSYYAALDENAQLLQNREGAFYLPSLLLSGKLYLKIGMRTGLKKYLWTAEGYLNLYMDKSGEPDWEYYYHKGMVFEKLRFPERAEVFYKKAIAKAQTRPQTAKALIGLMRVAVREKQFDLSTKYLLLQNTEILRSSSAGAFHFMMGMEQVLEKRYAEAIASFQNAYRFNEAYLIENPDDYLFVAESAFGVKRYEEAAFFFRRIITNVKDGDVVRHALMRLGDIAWHQEEMKRAADYYYQVAKRFPQTDAAAVARLKLIYLMAFIDIKAPLAALDEAIFGRPERYVAATLAKNRRSSVGRYALGNFGAIVLGLKTGVLDAQLEREIGLVNLGRLEAEHKAYIRRQWKPYLLQGDTPRICALYKANSAFFQAVFDRETLTHIAGALAACGGEGEALPLLRMTARKWPDDANRMRLAYALYAHADYDEALKVLNGVETQGCESAKLAAVCRVMRSQPFDAEAQRLQQCPAEDETARFIRYYRELDAGKSAEAEAYTLEHLPYLQERFGRERFAYRFTHKLLTALLHAKAYETMHPILLNLTKTVENNCFLNSLVLLSNIRSERLGTIDADFERIGACGTEWALIAQNVYLSYRLRAGAELKE